MKMPPPLVKGGGILLGVWRGVQSVRQSGSNTYSPSSQRRIRRRRPDPGTAGTGLEMAHLIGRELGQADVLEQRQVGLDHGGDLRPAGGVEGGVQRLVRIVLAAEPVTHGQGGEWQHREGGLLHGVDRVAGGEIRELCRRFSKARRCRKLLALLPSLTG